MYEVKDVIGMDGSAVGTSIVLTKADGSVLHIPEDEANSDYQAYLAWKAEQ